VSFTIQALIGAFRYSPAITEPSYESSKRQEAEDVAEDIVRKVKTQTSSQLFDSYIAQDFLDNVLRGGMPLMLGTSSL